MKRFCDFARETPFDGDKIPIADVLNREITILGFKKRPSKQKEGQSYITLQIELEGNKRVIFTGSDVLINQAEEYKAELPFITVIKKINNFYSFT